MPLFSYTARQPDGQTVQGTLTADSVVQARAALQEMNLIPEQLTEAGLAGNDVPSDGSWATVDSVPQQEEEQREYYPLVDTLRLYAGWLLAWYFVVFALGSYQYMRTLPFQIPYLEELFFSPLILNFSLAAFLFLLLSGLHRLLGRGYLLATIFILGGVGLFIGFTMNS